ncbi:RNA polymerase sigma-70 factor (ECF subfamily) [Streptosporangium becharense]|uniref:RNA polymerase sigma-70 factor (ECF subfamily) n=1 Tax=Streptosporangium becharense TaxID=1816182 RepID=A0A7W9MIN3_9ACTN|nr:RNA polymerase sigma factor SigJ [Streptosporangium becharense]MBB2913192.1 RNA polymerase sigma-70 factor (ECF subfamily) [Streptosporangium becharense]MBB5822175.1 RNA polymerase sigma-70 factor (ECF subfamily) [Streptosporangium becharense]
MSRPPYVNSDEDLAAEFGTIRPRLVGVAYGLLGSLDEAEDVVQDAWFRLGRADRSAIEDVTGWLVVTVSRLALDVLRSARVRREEYVGPWLPEPVVTDGDPADRVTLDESMSLAMLVVLESLSPAERTSFVLHDVFGLSFGEVARAVGRTPAACRQLAARARRHVAARAPRFEVDAAEHRRVVEAFARASQGRDIDALLALLDPEVVLRSDGGGVVRAARRPIHGAARVARFLVGVAERYGAGRRLAPVTVNGLAGLLWSWNGEVGGVYGLTVSDGRITEIDIVMNPEKLRSVR